MRPFYHVEMPVPQKPIAMDGNKDSPSLSRFVESLLQQTGPLLNTDTAGLHAFKVKMSRPSLKPILTSFRSASLV